MNKKEIYEKLVSLPPLPLGYIRCVHRCCGERKSQNIAKNGLVFNRKAAGLSPLETGGSYNSPDSMLSLYNEKDFWESLRQDDFACYNDARTADTKIVFDVPIEEFAFLEVFGRKYYGKIDSKYIVGVIPNINSMNKNLTLPRCYVDKAAYLSCHKKNYQPPKCNNQETMIDNLLEKYSSPNKTLLKQKIKRRISQEVESLKEEYALDFSLLSPKQEKKISQNQQSLLRQNTYNNPEL